MDGTREAIAELDGLPDTGSKPLEDLRALVKALLVFMEDHDHSEFTSDESIDNRVKIEIASMGILLANWLDKGLVERLGKRVASSAEDN